jgi:putative MATE family efflux protein
LKSGDSATSNSLLIGPIWPRLARLAVPNMAAMLVSSAVVLTETSYIGALGTNALAGMALVFPMVMLQGMLSAGAMGGGVSSAISRALGAGDSMRANALVLHAAIIGAVAGLLFMFVFLSFGVEIYSLLGGKDVALREALGYSNVVFLSVVPIWLNNTFASVIRGTGNMRVPSAMLILIAALQVLLSGCLGLGWGPFPRLGMAGVAFGVAIANTLGCVVFTWLLLAGRLRVRLTIRGLDLHREMFYDILKVGAFALLGPLQSISTILVLTGLMSRLGTQVLAGYGIGMRLEFLLIPITFAIGVACVPMVGMAIGAGNVERARRVAWTGAVAAASILGVFGLIVALASEYLAGFFTTDAVVLSAAQSYFVWAGPCYAMFGLAHCLYFAAQGAGKMLGPVLAGTARLLVVVVGGWWLLAIQAPAWCFFALLSASMIAYGVTAGIAMRISSWQPSLPTARVPQPI